MSAVAIVVAVGFGGLVGWFLGFSLPDTRPALITLTAGLVVGSVILLTSFGSEPAMAGGSLILGCCAGLLGLAPRLRRSSGRR